MRGEEMEEWLEELRVKVEGNDGHEHMAKAELGQELLAGCKPTTEESHEPMADGNGGHEPMASVGRRRRRGGRGSQLRRLLKYQALLSERRGLPPSRLNRLRLTEAESPRLRSRRAEEEESASPILRRRVGEEVRGREGGGRGDGGRRGHETKEEFARKHTQTSMRLFSEVEDTNPSPPPPTTPLHQPTTLPTTPKPNHYPQQRGVIPFPNLLSPNSTPSPHTPPSPYTHFPPPPLTLPFTPYQPLLQCGQTPRPLQVFCHGCHQFPFLVSVFV